MVTIAKENIIDPTDMRDAYCDALIDIAEKNENVVAVDCDLGSSMGTARFAKQFPNRSINCGIQEADGCGISAGLSATGYIPFFHTFAVFASRRVFDQAFLSCAYAGLNVKLIGGDAGVSAATNGGTHMAFEDVGIMRNIPTITIVEPSDTTMMKSIVPQIAESYGVYYMRSPRRKVRKIYESNSEFRIGKAEIVKEGTDVTIIACGLLVYEAILAAEELAKEGISTRVVDMFTIKPIDKQCVIESATKTGAIVTAENHNIINGLGSAVAEVIAENCLVPLERVGVQDEFGEVGAQDYLMERFKISAPYIVEKAKLAIKRKK